MSLVSASVLANALLATFSASSTHKKNATEEDAIEIGNLNEEAAIVTVSDQGATAGEAVTTTFTASSSGVTSLTQTIGNIVTSLTTTFTLMDSTGTVIASNDSLATDAQKAAYAEWTEGTLILEQGTYTAAATPGNGASLSIVKAEQQGTCLEVSSKLTGSSTEEYYKFSLSGSNIKLDLTSQDKSSLRVVLYDNNGAVVADSGGNTYQKANYVKLTSGTGLTKDSGDYTVKVTYAATANTTEDAGYSFKLYSGNTYSVVYKSKVEARPYDNTAAGSVTAADDAELYTHTAYNKIVTSPAKAINIGWMKQDESMLDVYSQLTAADSTNYFRFTLQEGNNLKFGFKTSTTTDVSAIRVQLLDRSGTNLIADSHGTAEQREAYEKMTSTGGIEAETGQYVIKITYAEDAEKSDNIYEFGLYSGSTYSAQYKTTASAQTYANALLANELTEKSTQVSLAAYLQGDDFTDSLITALKSV
jgi:hypothetical protein